MFVIRYAAVAAFCSVALSAQTLSLNSENPHYFSYKKKPALIITSGEHYGAVLNLDFDYVKYLDELAAHKLNGTRTFTGAYVEPQGAFNIAQNTLAPAENRFICPWARSDLPGYPNGGNKFDLTRWDEDYFKRLRDFLAQAQKRGIIVEMNLFCPFYEETQWRISPQNANNNINNVGQIARTNAYTLDRNGGLLAFQDAMVQKIVRELNSFDNLYYEICNEAYFGGVTLDWQHHIAETIAATEKTLPKKHLISRNVANGSAKVENPHPAISIFNFHYAAPPNTVPMNYGLNKALGDNETGFRGTNNLPYRSEAWAFILSGGALFNNLDYSFVAGQEDGTFVYPASQPGGGNRQYRRELRALHDFIYSFDFVHFTPANDVVRSGPKPGEAAYALANSRGQYAIYVGPTPLKKGEKAELNSRSLTLELALPDGNYTAQWLDPVTGRAGPKTKVKAAGGTLRIDSPTYAEDIALSIRRR